jgi:hypothetical protein
MPIQEIGETPEKETPEQEAVSKQLREMAKNIESQPNQEQEMQRLIKLADELDPYANFNDPDKKTDEKALGKLRKEMSDYLAGIKEPEKLTEDEAKIENEIKARFKNQNPKSNKEVGEKWEDFLKTLSQEEMKVIEKSTKTQTYAELLDKFVGIDAYSGYVEGEF